MSRRARSLVLAVALVATLVPFVPASADEAAAESTPNMTHVDTFAYGNRLGMRTNYGTDSAFVEMQVGDAVRTVGVFGSIGNGAFVMDVTDGKPVELGWYPCGIGQGDVQVFQREEADGTATYFTFTDDGYARQNGWECVQFARATNRFGNGQGTYIVEITDPGNPTTVGWVPFPKGSHNQTVHPSGRYLYNSNSELITNAGAAGIEIYDISDIANPVSVGTLALPVRPGLGTDSHDLSFNASGTRAYSAALSQTVIIDTTNPGWPKIITSFVDPMINVEHQADPITLTDETTGLTRDFLIVEDEFAGAAGAEQACPSGGVHVYDITGPLELAPVKVGYWNIDDVRAKPGLSTCTAHVFQLHPEAGLMTIGFYTSGVRVVDLSGLVGVALGGTGVGMREIGSYTFANSNSWSAKSPPITVGEDGSLDFHLYSDDITRGLDTFRFEGSTADAGTGADVWMSAAEAAQALGGATLSTGYRPFCLLRDDAAAAPAAGLLR